MDDGGLPTAVAARIRALEAIARTTTRDDLERLGRAVDELHDRKASYTESFWTGDTAGMRLSAGENDAFARLWTRMLVGLASAVSGHEVEEHAARRGFLARLDRFAQSPDAAATETIERALGGSVWRGVLGMWNAFCAALIPERFQPALLHGLEAPWRAALGRTPRETMDAEASPPAPTA
jgi:hypothetical protein